MDKEWKLGKDLYPNDNIMDDLTFDELITTIYCNEPIINEVTIQRVFNELIQSKIHDARDLLKINLAEIKRRCLVRDSEDEEEIEEPEDMPLTEQQREQLAIEIREFLLKNDLWIDITIYFNGKAFSTSDGDNFYYNDRYHLVVEENKNPRDYFSYVRKPNILSMSFEGAFYSCLNYNNERGAKFDDMIQEEFGKILSKYGLYYELGNAWNLSCYEV